MSRRRYALSAALLAALILFVALFVRDGFIRPYGGDVLITAFLCCAVRVGFPEKPRLLPLWVFLFAAGIEIGQYFRLVDLLGLGHIPFFRTWIGTVFSFADLLCYAVGCALFWAVEARVRVSVDNLRRNRALADAAEACRGTDGLYHGQRRPGLDALRFGYYSVGRSGCGPIGICNALSRLGLALPLPEIIAACERGIPFFGALMGLSPLPIPFIIRRLLRRAGCRDLRVRWIFSLPECLSPDEVLILTHFNSRDLRDGAHTVAVYADETGICVTNVYGRSAEPVHFSSPAAYLRGRLLLFAPVLVAGKVHDPAQIDDLRTELP